MGRIGILLAFAVIGFFIGIEALYIGRYLAPLLEQIPGMFQAEWIFAGLFGAVITIILVVIWSYTTKSS